MVHAQSRDDLTDTSKISVVDLSKKRKVKDFASSSKEERVKCSKASQSKRGSNEVDNDDEVKSEFQNLRDLINDKLQLVMDAIKCKVDHEKDSTKQSSPNGEQETPFSNVHCIPGSSKDSKFLNTEMEIKVQTVSVTELENAKEIDAAYEIKAHHVEQTEVDECTTERVDDHVCQMELHIVNFLTDLSIQSHENPDLVATSVHIVKSLDIEQHKSTQYLTKSKDFIPNDLLPSLNTERQIIAMHKSKISRQTPILHPRIRKPGRWKTSPYLIDFGSGYDHIFIPVNVARIHWVLTILSFNDRCLYVYDSYRSASHNASMADEMRNLSELIPTYLANSNFYKKKNIDFSTHPRYIGREKKSLLDVVYVDDLPQQSVESLNCGVYVVAYTEYISHEKSILPGFFDVEALRTRYLALLWRYGTQKIEENVVSEAKEATV
ncbi:hypothetical protein CQW23_30193 [Capsicum baccatum]|uniref:Ubiquitin-like protease family profile domain-containing protein n=1 Tax=Capsicum baccatum TaxID=33114 RepID=A0A2G2VBC0_CAPBA|nr:hypothetical protein CQW23_30193 [Capsicum baccatum]